VEAKLAAFKSALEAPIGADRPCSTHAPRQDVVLVLLWSQRRGAAGTRLSGRKSPAMSVAALEDEITGSGDDLFS